jgi:hypothetical protein
MLTKKENIKNEVKSNKGAKTTSPSSAPGTQAHEHSGSCCQPSTKTANQQQANANKTYQAATQATKQQDTYYTTDKTDKKTSSKTRITIKYDVGFPNQLYIRGKGANLSWDKGQLLKNVKPDEWVWETDAHFTHCEFKVLINDRIYENGDNHQLNAGSNLLYTPHFY